MGKYSALGTFLRRWAVRNDGQEVELSFARIEGLIGAPLPKAASHTDWWCGDESSVQSRAWLDAGFKARLNEGEEFVIFGRCATRDSNGTTQQGGS